MTGHASTAATDVLDPPLRMDGVAYCQVALSPPFAAAAPLADEWRLYIVRGEKVVLRTADAAAGLVPLSHGTIACMSGRLPHWFESSSVDANVPAAEWQEMPLGTPTTKAATTVVLVGRIPQSAMPILALIGEFMTISADEHPELVTRIGSLIDLIAEETRRDDTSTKTIVLKLAEVIMLELGRAGRTHHVLFSERPREGEYDARIWRSIAAISRAPHQHWTVESMADIAGMSRSAFAARYRETVGMTPVRSLRRLRMHRAATWLTHPGSQTLAPLALATGYGSEAAFCRAFAKEFGYPPKRYGIRNLTAAQIH